MDHQTLTTPLSGKFFIGRVRLAMANQCTKFEVSKFTRYEAMNQSINQSINQSRFFIVA